MTEKFLMARNFYRIFTENNPIVGDSKTFGIPEAKGLKMHGYNFRGVSRLPSSDFTPKLSLFVKLLFIVCLT